MPGCPAGICFPPWSLEQKLKAAEMWGLGSGGLVLPGPYGCLVPTDAGPHRYLVPWMLVAWMPGPMDAGPCGCLVLMGAGYSWVHVPHGCLVPIDAGPRGSCSPRVPGPHGCWSLWMLVPVDAGSHGCWSLWMLVPMSAWSSWMPAPPWVPDSHGCWSPWMPGPPWVPDHHGCWSPWVLVPPDAWPPGMSGPHGCMVPMDAGPHECLVPMDAGPYTVSMGAWPWLPRPAPLVGQWPRSQFPSCVPVGHGVGRSEGPVEAPDPMGPRPVPGCGAGAGP